MQGTEYIPLEEYLQGALAAYLLRGYNDEELKAISIVLRTNLVVDLERGLVPQLEQMSYARQRSEFAEQYDSNRKRILDILQETSGQILLYEGSVVEVLFFDLQNEQESYNNILCKYFKLYSIYQYW
ncbi:MAG TPA: SpoIID/LytB domain-containing protein [Lachnospiraceae bacterium]|nr:SpoIID/LytB domain-containing protein [Lachnospiraceae bacterium]